MKGLSRVVVLILAALLCLGVAGCAPKGGLNMAGHEWRFSAVQSRKNGEILYASSADQQAYGGVYAQAPTLELTCKIGKNKVELKNKANGQTWTWAYQIQTQMEDMYIYDLSQAEQTAVATVTKTEYADGSRMYTLQLTFEDKTLYFYDE